MIQQIEQLLAPLVAALNNIADAIRYPRKLSPEAQDEEIRANAEQRAAKEGNVANSTLEPTPAPTEKPVKTKKDKPTPKAEPTPEPATEWTVQALRDTFVVPYKDDQEFVAKVKEMLKDKFECNNLTVMDAKHYDAFAEEMKAMLGTTV